MVKVLHVVSSLGGGGVESMLYNYYTKLDKKLIQFDFVVHGDDIGVLEKKLQAMGSRVFHVTPKKVSLSMNIREIDRIIKDGEYDVVHCHQNFSNSVPLLIARKYRVRGRISHAHGCKTPSTTREAFRNYCFRLLNKLGANYFFCCGVQAGKWLHGKRWSPSESDIIMNNAIDVDKFSYDPSARAEYRRRLDINGKMVLLHVGRFSDEKNHSFLVTLFHMLSKRANNYVLLLVGDGPTEDKVRKHVRDIGLSDQVRFLGVRSDVAQIMDAADVFLLPSKNEGLPVTLVEAQAKGLIVFASDVITRETAITDSIEYLPIEDPSIWVREIARAQVRERYSRENEIQAAGYSVSVEADKYMKWLEKHVVRSPKTVRSK